jgi:hypothetical protein
MAPHPNRDMHPVLRRKMLLDRYVGTPVMGLIAAGIFWSVARAAVRGDEPLLLMGLRGAIGALFLWAAVYAWRCDAWYHRASWVLNSCPGVPMEATFGTNSTGGVLATLRSPESGEVFVTCGPPRWALDLSRPSSVLAHVDPEEGGPVIIETEEGILWPLERTPSRRKKMAQGALPERIPLDADPGVPEALRARVGEILEAQGVPRLLPPARTRRSRAQAVVAAGTPLAEAHAVWREDYLSGLPGLPPLQRQPAGSVAPEGIVRVVCECIEEPSGGKSSHFGFKGKFVSLLVSLPEGRVWDARVDKAS